MDAEFKSEKEGLVYCIDNKGIVGKACDEVLEQV
jgi:hypothetical protein